MNSHKNGGRLYAIGDHRKKGGGRMKSNSSDFSYRQKVILIVSLVMLDILVKILIQSYFMDSQFLVTRGFGISPHLNTTQLSIFNRELQLDVRLGHLILMNIALLAIFVIAQKRIRKEKIAGDKLYFWTIPIEVGAICSLIDKIVWHGSLDYLLIRSSVVDLKDIYMFVGFIMLVFWSVWPRLREKYEILLH